MVWGYDEVASDVEALSPFMAEIWGELLRKMF
jgi:hypothetical protein